MFCVLLSFTQANFHSTLLHSLKKEEFYLNRKRVQKSEVMSLLESAGFSKSNPYYIVQQGKVANLCVMKDKDRLNLLKEVAGTTVYEERRAESVKIMLDTANKKEKVEVKRRLLFVHTEAAMRLAILALALTCNVLHCSFLSLFSWIFFCSCP